MHDKKDGFSLYFYYFYKLFNKCYFMYENTPLVLLREYGHILKNCFYFQLCVCTWGLLHTGMIHHGGQKRVLSPGGGVTGGSKPHHCGLGAALGYCGKVWQTLLSTEPPLGLQEHGF